MTVDITRKKRRVDVASAKRTLDTYRSRQTVDVSERTQVVDLAHTCLRVVGADERPVAVVWGSGDEYFYALYNSLGFVDRILRIECATDLVEIATNATDFSETGADWIGRESLTYGAV